MCASAPVGGNVSRLDIPVRSTLYDFQLDAVESVESFLDADESRGNTFIVSMPTGSGKSGVIAYVAQDRVGDAGDVLLLCPWDALVTQLSDDVGARFWNHAGVDASSMLAPVRLYPSTARGEIQSAEKPTIWIMTLAALVGMAAEDRRSLEARLQTVIVDEGHYEPAPSWAQAVRKLGKRTLLFTATPFRNDVKYFDVAEGDSFHYSARVAIESGRLRTPEFHSISVETPQSFVEQLTAFVEENLNDADKIIVRCATQQEIKRVVQLLQRAEQSVLGIHERFTAEDSSDGLVAKVPATHEARYWVHQNKLIEGVDHSEFRCVALYRPPRSDRALIQQIGRVLRGAHQNPRALVLGISGDDLRRVWDAFLSYDFQNDSSVSSIRGILGLASGRHFYTSGTFRLPLDIENIDPKELRVPRSFTVHELPASATDPTSLLLQMLDTSIGETDGEKVGSPIAGEWTRPESPPIAWVAQLVYVSEQSPILARSSFNDSSLALAFFAVTGSRVYAQPAVRLDFVGNGFRTVSPDVLRSAFAESNGTFTSVSLKNTDFSSTAERTRTQTAVSLSDLAPDLGDYFKSPSTITGTVSNVALDGEKYGSLRYVGFSKSRIREHGRVSIDECLNWLAQIEAALLTHATNVDHSIFSRYAEIVYCGDPVAQNFLLDLDAATMNEYVGTDGMPLNLTDICVDLVSDSSLKLFRMSDNEEFECSLTWSGRRYEFASVSLDSEFSSPVSRYVSLSAEISDRQAFRLIVHDRHSPDELMQYVDAQFVRPRSSMALSSKGSGVALDGLLVGAALSAITSEKGSAVDASTWTQGSMFRLICEEIKAGTLFGERISADSLVVCDDDSGETADFYVVDGTNRKLIAIHAKVKAGNGGRGASGLHDVAAQAQKHLGTMRPGGRGFDRKKMTARWEKRWTLLEGSKVPRIQSGHDAATAAALVWNALRDPSYEREVLIATAGILSKNKFMPSARRGTPQALQALYLIQSVWASAGAVGARLRIVVNE
ncbi:hypothetical protein B7495_06130 [Cryobacterium sp. LW097]|nr:hypothetical protein B7495_06130 [Cryobacterium sp. LW097]